MKKNLMYGLCASLAAAAMSTGCSDTFNPTGSTSGRINPVVGLDTEVVTSRSTSGSRATASSVTVNDLNLHLQSLDGSVDRKWESVADFNSNEEFKATAYTLTAFYGSEESEGFDAPWYYGQANLVVEENETTNVALTVNLANAMVTVVYTDAFRNYFAAWSAEVVSSQGTSIPYGADESRPAYVHPGNVVIYAEVTKPNGVEGRIEAARFAAEAKHHYTVTVDINGGQAGDAQLVITFDDMLDQEDVVIDLTDDLLSTTSAPKIITDGFDPSAEYEIIEGQSGDIKPSLFIDAAAGIKSVVMTTESATLADQGWPVGELDLVAASPAQQTAMKNLGMKVRGLYGNVDRIATIDLTNVLASMHYRAAGSNTSKFTFVVTDKKGKQSEPVTVNVSVLNLTLSMSVTGELKFGADNLDVRINYNGPALESNVKVQYKNERDTWSNAVISSATLVSDGVYDVHVTGLPTEDNLVIRASYGSSIHTPAITVARGDGLSVTSAEANVYSTSATINLEISPDLNPADAVVELSTDGTNFSPANARRRAASRANTKLTYTLNGLTPGTTYTVRVTIGEFTDTTVLTTESAEQLPNADMETWHSENPYSNTNQLVWYPGADTDTPWGTMNLLTTSEASSSAKGAFQACSGTMSTTSAHTGSAAAYIASVGYGSGNSTPGLIAALNPAKCNNVAAGQLYLGHYDSSSKQPVYGGYAFTSRPKSMSFFYKYTAKNSADYGYAEITLYDASGKVIATKSTQLTAASDYSKVTLALDYTSSAKAASISVVFKSSDNADCLVYSTTNFSTPTRNKNETRFTGSELYIDDIILNY